MVPDAPAIGESLPELPPMRRPAAVDDIRLEAIAEDTAAAAAAHFVRAKIVAGNPSPHSSNLLNSLMHASLLCFSRWCVNAWR